MPLPPDLPAIAVRGLRKSYGEQTVLNGLDLEVPPGSVFSLLGPNGAGKTTAVNILTMLIRADAGEVRVAGHSVSAEPDAVRAAIGVTGQFSAVDRLLTGAENLYLMGDLHHLPRPETRQRAAALLHEGLDLLPADKPTAQRAALEELLALADFFDERLPKLLAEWRERRAALRAEGKLTDPTDLPH